MPKPLAELAGAKRFRAGRNSAEVTWRIASKIAGPGYFLAGDAALVLDPASSHGVLRALMSGMFAAHVAAQVCAGGREEKDAAAFDRRLQLTPLGIAAALGGMLARLSIKNSPSWMQPTVLIADVRTQEVFFWNSRSFASEDARYPNALRAKLRDAFEDLADVTKRK